MKTLTFSSKVNTVPVSIDEKQYELREMLAANRDKYLDKLTDRIEKDGAGNPSIKKFDGLQADLLSSCMFRSDGTPVPREDIQSWPASVATQLFKEAQILNHLADTEPTKNV